MEKSRPFLGSFLGELFGLRFLNDLGTVKPLTAKVAKKAAKDAEPTRTVNFPQKKCGGYPTPESKLRNQF
jgi:hypothetical protein